VSEISAAVVKALRERTGAGMMDCKKALTDAAGDANRAVDILRERGLAKAVKRAGREASEGAVAMAQQPGVGAMVELRCETDFVAKTPEFQKLASSLASLVASSADLADVDSLLGASLDGGKVSERLSAAMATIGENIVLQRAGRLAAADGGLVGGYVHAGGKLGVLVALRAPAGEAAQALAKDLAMHVAAADPSPVAIDRSGVADELLASERELFRRQAEQEGKPAPVIEKIVEGRVRKLYTEICLVEQPFVKDPDQSIAKLLEAAGKVMGGPVAVTGFLRFKLGESASA
jgi:elongation factor Ts